MDLQELLNQKNLSFGGEAGSTKALLVVPENSLLPFHRERIVAFTQSYISDSDTLEIAVAEESEVSIWSRQFPDLPVSLFAEKLGDHAYSTWFIAKVGPDADFYLVPGNSDDWVGTKIYSVTWEGSVISLIAGDDGWQPMLERNDTPYAEEHVFSRLAPRVRDRGFYLFPFGHFSLTGRSWGKMNSFGHRIDQDFAELEGREKNHKVIAVFGGSTVFSACCQEDETFCARLEQKFSNLIAEQKIDYCVTVLNFGIPANLVQDQINTYILFAERFSPDLIISHSGFNDLNCGMLNDPTLIKKYRINYLNGVENWATYVPSSGDVPLTQSDIPGEPLKITGPPKPVIDTFLFRQFQFQRLIGERSQFLWGLEPLWFAKNLTEEESALCRMFFDTHKTLQPVFDRMPRLYEMLQTEIKNIDPGYFINFPDKHKKFGEDLFAFSDPVHQAPDGDNFIAEIYFDYIAENFSETFEGMDFGRPGT